MLQLIVNTDDPNQSGLLESFESDRLAAQTNFIISATELPFFHRPVIASTTATQPWQDDWTTGDFFEFAIGDPGDDNLCYASVTPVGATEGFEYEITINTNAVVAAFAATTDNSIATYFSIKRTRADGTEAEYYQRKVVLKRSVVDPSSAIPTPAPQYVLQGPITTSGLTATAGVLLGRYTASTGNIQQITVGTNLTLNSTTGVLSATGGGGSGDITAAGDNVYLVGGSNTFASATNSFGSLNLDAVASTLYGPDGLGLYASGGITYLSGGGGALLDLTSSAFTGDWTHSGLLMTISGTTSGGVTMAADAGDTLHEATAWGLNLGLGSNGAVTSYIANTSNWGFFLERDYLTTQGVLQHEAYFEDNTAYPAHRPFIAAWSQQFNATVNSITAGVVVLASAPTNNYIRSGLRFKFPTLTGTVSGITANQFYYVKRRISATSFAFSSSVYSSAITFSVASPTQATCSAVAAHGFTTGQTVTIYGVTTGTFSGTVNGQQTITVTGTHTFTIDGLACTVAGSGGTVLGGSGAENTGGATTGGTMQRGGYGAAAFTMPAKVVAYSYDSVDITSVTAFEVNNQVTSAATKVLLSNAVSGSAQAFIQTNSTFKFGQGAVYGGSSNSFDISSLNTGTTVDFSMNYTSGWVKMGYTSDASAVAPASRLDVNGTVTATSVTTQNLLAENGFPAVVSLSTGGGATGALTIQSVGTAINLTNSTASGDLNLTTASGVVAVAGNTITAGTGTLTLGTFTLTVPSTGTAVTTSTLSGGTLAISGTTGAFSSGLNATGNITAIAASTQDAIRLAGRAGGTSSYILTLSPTTLTASRTVTFPDASITVARTDAAQTFTGTQTFNQTILSNDFSTTQVGANNSAMVAFGTFGATVRAGYAFAWGGSGNATISTSTSLSRYSDGIVQFGTTTNNDSGSWRATNGTLLGTLAVTGATTLTGLLTTNGGISIAGGQNIALSTTTGTKIGTGTTQLLGFYNATPVDQPAAVADITGGAVPQTAAGATDCMDKINLILARLRELGLIAT